MDTLKRTVSDAISDTVAENTARSAPETIDPHLAPARGGYLALVSLAALGVVYGDIGTSPLYALRECFHGPHAIAVTPANVLGVLSLVFWSLIIVVTVKYIVFILQADNRGEGGILALMALATPIKVLKRSERWWLVVLGVFGAALLYGDGIITPAISVLSAVEGLTVATPFFAPYIVPITIAIIVGLFMIQRHGTASIGTLFGPVMIVWFTVLAVLGIAQAWQHPAIFSAVNPLHGIDFFRANGRIGFFTLGSVFLVVTGGEALYADLGHFGRRPIRLAWFVVVLPALLLNYFGQGALLMSNPAAAVNPFYLLAPSWALYPMVALATLATVIASQALISGAFSITMQAMRLGFLPRLQILHTSSREFGQIYIPAVNWLMMATCILIVLGFRTSSHLAAAYGIAVTSTMAITTIIFYIVAVERWRWSRPAAGALAGSLFVVDAAFLAANVVKIPQGGWFPIVVAAVIFVIMTTWKTGRRLVSVKCAVHDTTLEDVMGKLRAETLQRVPGTAVFLSSEPLDAPAALLTNLACNRVIHDQVVLLTVNVTEVSHVGSGERVRLESLGSGVYRVTLSFGFMEVPDVPEALAALDAGVLTFDPQSAIYFVGRSSVIASNLPGMALWRDKLFALLSRNAATAGDYFALPARQVVEIGMRVEF